MIPILVIDDDYRVASIHAAIVEQVPGFHCVGEAHSAAEARTAIRDFQPELLLLDIHLPDEDGLSLLRTLKATVGRVPDCIVVTAARDLHAVRTAMHLGAVYYLVKPFGVGQLRDQLRAYRRWREQLESSDQADQETVDALYNLLRAPTALNSSPPSQLPPTMAKILDAVSAAAQPVSATQIAQQLGMSRPTAQRYLADLQRRGLVALDLAYGSTGRPVHRYHPAAPDRRRTRP
ncbi:MULTISPECIES: response regulator [unclassified Frankia]|uniref:response regulator n=1 Tax=unclassified Frankia TaxID=2632575 RepID=UPI002AD26D2F|nr:MULTISPECIES: response regulator [unclassified Frankia]